MGPSALFIRRQSFRMPIKAALPTGAQVLNRSGSIVAVAAIMQKAGCYEYTLRLNPRDIAAVTIKVFKLDTVTYGNLRHFNQYAQCTSWPLMSVT
ncbi:hypothetical protein ACLKA6_009723 [Drosophila palustris]